jgi:integrase
MSHGLGAYPQTTLQAARTKAFQAKEIAKDGKNISTTKRLTKEKQIEKDATTFELIAKEWLKHSKDGWSPNHYERNEGLVRRYLNPDLGKLPIESISEALLLKVLKATYDKGQKESARRARVVAGQIFTFAKLTHRATHNVANELADNPYLKKPPVKHFKALPQNEVGKLINELNKSGKEQKLDIRTQHALHLALLTGLRDSSIRGAKWQEIDWDKAIWVVPAERMKSRREHKVPLPTQAISALKKLQALSTSTPGEYIFKGTGKSGFMSENTLCRALKKMGLNTTLHGLRSLITDVLNENGFHPDAIERQLDHVEGNKVRRAYLRSDFMEKRKHMMQWFADWCDAKDNDSINFNNVVNMRDAA